MIDKQTKAILHKGCTMTIFIIEDDEIYGSFLAQSLNQTAGRTVHTFTRAEDALGAIDALRPDTVICDFRLPGLSGIEMFEQVKDRLPKDGKFIMISALDDGLQVLSFIQRGLRDYVIKDHHVVEALNAVLENRDEELFY